MAPSTNWTDADRRRFAKQAARSGVTDIAKRADVTPDTVRGWMRKFGVPNVPDVLPSAVSAFDYRVAVGIADDAHIDSSVSDTMLGRADLSEDQFDELLNFAATGLAHQMELYCFSGEADESLGEDADGAEVYEAAEREGHLEAEIFDFESSNPDHLPMRLLEDTLELRPEDHAELKRRAIEIFDYVNS